MNATEEYPDGRVVRSRVSAVGYATALLLGPGDQVWCREISDRLVDEDGEIVFVLADGCTISIEPLL